MKVVVVTQYYPPDPPSWIPAGLVPGLSRLGHDVRVLTTYPHYETGRVSHGFRQRWRDERSEDGVQVRRVPIVPSHSDNAIGRVLNYVSFAVSTRLARRFVKDCDVAYVYATPMTVAEAPRVWAHSLRLPFVLHVQDMWPESVTGSGILPGGLNTLAETMLNRWLHRVYRRASHVIAIAPRMQDMLERRGVDPDRVSTILNWSNDGDQVVPDRSGLNPPPGLALVYAGNLGRMQDLRTVIQAVGSLQDLPGLVLRIAGWGVEEPALRRLVQEIGVQCVEFLGRLSANEMDDLYSRSDFQLVTLKDLAIFEGTLPSKFASGLARGVPAITNVRGDLSDMVRAQGVGFTAEPENAASLAAAIERAYRSTQSQRREMSRGAREFYDVQMSRDAGIRAIEKALAEAAASVVRRRK